MKKDVTKDIKESCNRLGFEKGPWSSWLTPFEAKRRFPHAEEIAGSNPAGPTISNHLSGIPTFSEVFPYFPRGLVQVFSFWLFEPLMPYHGSYGC